MAEQQAIGPIVQVKINGDILQKPVDAVQVPRQDRPYWKIFLRDGNVIYGTDDVSVEVHPQGISQTELEDFTDIIGMNKP